MMVKKGYAAERERQLQLREEGFHVTRTSGSSGAMDLLAVKFVEGNFIVKYEQVKSTKFHTFYFDKNTMWELERLKEIEEKYNIPCYFSIKFSRKGWLIFRIGELTGRPIKYK